MDSRSARAYGAGVAAPVVFIIAWAVGSGVGSSEGYSTVDDAISRLAADGASTWWILTAGLVLYAALFGTLARLLWRHDGLLALALAANTVATLAVAATPLGHSSALDSAHGAAALSGYVTLLAIPPLACRPGGTGPVMPGRWLIATAWPASAVALVALALSSLAPSTNGLWQRVGLTTLDVWIIVWCLRGFRHSSRPSLGTRLRRHR